MTGFPEDERPVQPAYGPAGRPPPPPGAPQPQPYGWSPPHGWSPPYGQPPVARPQFGAHPSDGHGTPTRRRTGLVWALVAAVGTAVVIGVVLSATLRPRVLDPGAVQRDVAAQFEEHEGVAIRLDCADSMALTPGATYRCRGTTAAGEQVTLLIRVTDARTARYTWSEQR